MCPKANYTFNLREVYKGNEKVDDVCFDLLSKMLILDPHKRISIKEALEHNYFKTKPLMCKPEELPIIGEDSHEYQSRKEYKQKKLLMEVNKNNNNNMMIGIGNIEPSNNFKNEFLGIKRNAD